MHVAATLAIENIDRLSERIGQLKMYPSVGK